MGNFINKGNDGFASIRKTNFVDKSMLITEISDDEKISWDDFAQIVRLF